MTISIEGSTHTGIRLANLTEDIAATPRKAAPGLIGPEDPGYDTYRKPWNKLFDRRPATIARCLTAQDVAAALRFATSRGLPVAVRSGGHSVAGYSTIEGGVLIDLSLMKELTIDPQKRVATAGPGLTWGDFSGQAARYGLTTPAGDSASVGVGGLTTGGGIGWLARKYGMTIDHLRSAEVVTASGEIVTASPTEHPDLFWAIRGGGGNFGIVTRFEFNLVPVGEVLAGVLVFPAEPEILAAYTQVALEAPDELTTISDVMKVPPIPFLSSDLYGKLHFLVTFCYAGDPEEGRRAIAPLASIGPVLGRMVAPMPYPGIYKFTEAGTVSSAAVVRNHFLNGLDEDEARAIIASGHEGTSPHSMVQIRALGGQMARVPVEATAFAHRDKPVLVVAINPWNPTPGEQTAVHTAWADQLWQKLSPRSAGSYVGFQGDEDKDGELTQAVYPTATYSRLAQVKATYDPGNLFKANRNIAPAGASSAAL